MVACSSEACSEDAFLEEAYPEEASLEVPFHVAYNLDQKVVAHQEVHGNQGEVVLSYACAVDQGEVHACQGVDLAYHEVAALGTLVVALY